MTETDLPDVARIADIVHAAFPERPAVFAERLALFPDGCLMTAGGYAIAHPVRAGKPPKLDTLLGTLPPDADALHIHDVALLPARRGNSLGAAALTLFTAAAARHGLARMTLVSVYGTASYWGRLGFRADGAADVRAYGADAVHMSRAV